MSFKVLLITMEPSIFKEYLMNTVRDVRVKKSSKSDWLEGRALSFYRYFLD